MRTIGMVLLVVLGLASCSSVAAAAKPKPKACTLHGQSVVGVAHSHKISVTGRTVVYRTRNSTTDTYWACLRGQKKRVKIGVDDTHQLGEDEYGRSASLVGMHVSGDWLIAIQQTGADEASACSKYAGANCPSPVATLVLLNVAKAKRIILASTPAGNGESLIAAPSSFTRVLLSAQGALAWLVAPNVQQANAPPTLYGCVATVSSTGSIVCASRQIAQENLLASSLNLTGTTLTWTSEGQTRTTSL